MAHKTLIGGTTYDITGGKTLVSGTSYSVKNGKVLIGGTAYDISFAKQYPAKVQNFWSSSWYEDEASKPSYVTCATYAKGYWVVGGYSTQSSSYIAYAKSLEGPWTTKKLWTGSSGYVNSSTIRSITYTNGYFVVCGRTYSSSTSGQARIAYATSPDGDWTIKDIWSSFRAEIYSITYGNGYWIVGGCSGGSGNSEQYAKIAYSTSLNGTWTTNTLISSSNGTAYVQKILYENGYFVAACYWQYSYNSNKSYPRIAYATTPTGTWTTQDLWSIGTVNSYINDLIYANGYWVAVGCYYSSSTYYARLAYATSPTGTWTIKDLWSNTNSSCQLYDIIHDGTSYVVRGYKTATTWCTATSLNGTWTNITVPASSIMSFFFMDFIDGNYLAGGQYTSGTTSTSKLANAPTLEELGTTQ